MKQKLLWLAAAALALLCLLFFRKIFHSPNTHANAVYHKLTPQEAKARLDQGGVILLDVRRQDEYDMGHIPGAILLPNEDIGDTPPAELPDQGAEILLYCRSGRRSKEAARKLANLGYVNVYDMGGIADWPFAIEK